MENYTVIIIGEKNLVNKMIGKSVKLNCKP